MSRNASRVSLLTRDNQEEDIEEGKYVNGFYCLGLLLSLSLSVSHFVF